MPSGRDGPLLWGDAPHRDTPHDTPKRRFGGNAFAPNPCRLDTARPRHAARHAVRRFRGNVFTGSGGWTPPGGVTTAGTPERCTGGRPPRRSGRTSVPVSYT